MSMIQFLEETALVLGAEIASIAVFTGLLYAYCTFNKRHLQ